MAEGTEQKIKVIETKSEPVNLSAQSNIVIRCHGMFYFKRDSQKGIRQFELEVRAPSLELFRETSMKLLGTNDDGQATYRQNSYVNVRGELKKRYLPVLLQKQAPDFARVRYVVIDEITREDGKEITGLQLTLQSKKQLAGYIRERQIPVSVDDYIDIDQLRTDILEYEHDPQVFLASKSRKDKRRAEERAFLEMNDLNETLPPLKTKPAQPATSIEDL